MQHMEMQSAGRMKDPPQIRLHGNGPGASRPGLADSRTRLLNPGDVPAAVPGAVATDSFTASNAPWPSVGHSPVSADDAGLNQSGEAHIWEASEFQKTLPTHRNTLLLRVLCRVKAIELYGKCILYYRAIRGEVVKYFASFHVSRAGVNENCEG